MLPKFLIADNSQQLPDKVFVVHCETPKFILECDIEDPYKNPVFHWIDNVGDNDDVDSLKEAAFDFLEDELDNQEDLYEDDDDE